MLIPYQELSSEALDNLIESFILREGTDYGEFEISLIEKKHSILQQLKQGCIVILYSQLSNSVTLIDKDDLKKQQ
ncbi:YheU family protein [Psychromonas sp. MME2]|uniref:YheU family protein n=1 Tax=unclassified Psychromonas TaxID=2614957 RepID=UPI00339D297C